jgi:hypothetical protein
MVDDASSSKNRPVLLLGLLVAGLWLLLIGTVAIVSGTWPFYLTWIQLDGLHTLFSPLGEGASTYVIGAFSGMLGLVICVVCALIWRRMRA